MITLTEAPSGGGIKGAYTTAKDLNGVVLPVSPINSRSLADGVNVAGPFPAPTPIQAFGTMVGALNTTTGQMTLPANGYYAFTTFISFSIDSPLGNGYSQLFTEAAPPAPAGTPGPPNPNGFMGLVGGTPASSASAFPVNFPDYFGSFTIGIGTPTGTIIICSNTQTITYDTSHVLISASYTLRYVNVGSTPIFNLKYLNKTNNNIQGQSGNSFHFSVAHIQ